VLKRKAFTRSGETHGIFDNGSNLQDLLAFVSLSCMQMQLPRMIERARSALGVLDIQLEAKLSGSDPREIDLRVVGMDIKISIDSREMKYLVDVVSLDENAVCSFGFKRVDDVQHFLLSWVIVRIIR